MARHGLVRDLPRLKFEKDHLCFACAMGKSKKQSHKPISEDTNQEKLYLLHMDLCGPMRVASVNGNKLNATMRNIRTDNGTEFVNQTLRDYYEQVGIYHETSVARTPQQNGVVERRNRTLVEAEACLTSKSIPPGIDDDDFDLKKDLLTLERLLNSDPTSTLPMKEQKFKELKTVEPSSDELPSLELKDLPSSS
ncbi:retrovirus-related pol polyprotein from transposon TNT 1-94 [Tanacetum coccineum]|uniref:Retrovirus-related pol polyprotein from transposon TNT 1-94 n=1 Tax=Tanacetum coccineum TaxID=301880 RepID=A0ABQ4XJW4_9ASTR